MKKYRALLLLLLPLLTGESVLAQSSSAHGWEKGINITKASIPCPDTRWNNNVPTMIDNKTNTINLEFALRYRTSSSFSIGPIASFGCYTEACLIIWPLAGGVSCRKVFNTNGNIRPFIIANALAGVDFNMFDRYLRLGNQIGIEYQFNDRDAFFVAISADAVEASDYGKIVGGISVGVNF